jgi:hypothetical protein
MLVEGVLIVHVDEHRRSADSHDRSHCGVKRVRLRDDFVASANLERFEAQDQRVGPRIGADYVPDLHELAQAPLVFQHWWTDGELTGGYQGAQIVENSLRLSLPELTVEIVVRDLDFIECWGHLVVE